MQIHQSAEDYLETILMLTQRMGRVRSIDVVNELGYTKASVSIAMKKLRENGYIAVDGEGNLTLLEPGREIAERIYSRHRLLTHFFVQLGVDEDVAAEDACKAEHILSEQTLKKIREYALLHDAEGNSMTVEALDTIIPELQKQGYKFVTVTELFKIKGIEPDMEKVYTNVLQKNMYN
mgnify:FL=1